MKLPGILLQEEVDGNQKEENNIDDYLVKIHNEAYKTISLVHLIVKVTKPMYEDLENKLKATHLKIRALEKRRRQYENDNFIDLAPFYWIMRRIVSTHREHLFIYCKFLR